MAWDPRGHDRKPHTHRHECIHENIHLPHPLNFALTSGSGKGCAGERGCILSGPGQERVRDGATGQRRISIRRRAKLPEVTDIKL